MKKQIPFILISLITLKLFSQIEGAYEFNIDDNKYYKISSITDSKIYNRLQFACDKNTAQTCLNKMRQAVKEYIISRTNYDFYNKLKLFRAEIAYANKNSSYNINVYSKKHKHFYWFNYGCILNGVSYSFALRTNEDGEVIYNLNFPDKQNQIFIDKIIDPKIAIKKAKSIKKSISLRKSLVTLNYLKNEKLLCYVIERDPKIKKNIKRNPEYYEYTSNKIYINAYTNEFVKEETRKEQVFGTSPIGILNSKTE